jgi:hypothetical protein
MSFSAAAPLVDTLRQRVLRMRTGVLLLEAALLGKEAELAARLGIAAVDVCSWMLRRIEPQQRFLGIRWEMLINDLAAIAEDRALSGDCVLVYNMDVVLAAVLYDERLRFWNFLRSSFRPHRGIILALPQGAPHLFDSADRACWERDGRLAAC